MMIWLGVIGGILLLIPQVAFNQTDEAVCTAFVEQAFGQAAAQCGNLDVNTSCSIGAVESLPPSEPGQMVSLYPLRQISSAALDTTLARYGITVFNSQAGHPSGVPGVKGLLLGEAMLTNNVAEETALHLSTPLPVTVLVGANIRRTPDTGGHVLGSVPAGTTLQTDAVTADYAWLRVLAPDVSGWMSSTVVQLAGDINSLPVIGADTLSPLQNFCLQTTDQNPVCSAPPPLLLLQTAEGAAATMIANGSPILIDGTVALRATAGQMQIMVIQGTAGLGVLTLPPGFTATIPTAGCAPTGTWAGSRPLSSDELAGLAPLADIPVNLLYTPIHIPSEGEIQAIARTYGQVYGSASGQLDCSRFQVIQPVGNVPFGMTAFYWEAVPEATSYRVRIYNNQGNELGAYDSGGPNTNIQVDLSSGGFGGDSHFFWGVEALLNG
ncbi:MAG: SH3 domain-containing protein, partial [Anaerolineae bacterium]|nr:SH3 domain-containing protein [Anaerolineae bacterium]